MYEQIKNPYYQQILKLNPLLANAIRPRDVAIFHAYDRITMSLRGMLRVHYSREMQKCVEFKYPDEVIGKPFIRGFVCHYCAVTLSLHGADYIITLTIGKEVLDKGSGMNSTAVMRVAFKHTMVSDTAFTIENCLQIVLINNTYALFKRKEEEADRKKILWNAGIDEA